MKELAESWGVDTQYLASFDEWIEPPRETIDAILKAMGAAEIPPPRSADGPLIVTAGIRLDVSGSWQIDLESGEVIEGSGALPAELPLGYHHISNEQFEKRLLIVAPSACPALRKRWWGWTAQLYAMRSSQSWGIGDFGDLRTFAGITSKDGAGFVIVNPLHAPLPGVPQEPSPYFPSSREFVNPIYIRVEDVPGAGGYADLVAVADAGRALNADRHIDRDSIWTLKNNALRAIWQQTEPSADFLRFAELHGDNLRNYAVHCALTEQFGVPWQKWPDKYKHPQSPAVSEFAAGNEDEIRFQQWMQWLLDVQLAEATQATTLIKDLAVGVDPKGADAWLWQDVMALGMRVGAPPDDFNVDGQDWSIPPFDPWKLRAANYEPFIRTVRAALTHSGGMRIDHVMGMFRLFWIPEGGSPRDGAYVRYPWSDLLAIVALESHRASAVVIGEDLGTVEPNVRTELAARNILSYKLMWFEKNRPTEFPNAALGATTTHDLPTIAGLWSGRDLNVQLSLGITPNVEGSVAIKEKLKLWLAIDDGAEADDIAEKCHHLLAQSPAALVSATVEDALGLEERPNYPGTISEWPNWSLALPTELEQLKEAPGYLRTVEAFRSIRGVAQRQSNDVS